MTGALQGQSVSAVQLVRPYVHDLHPCLQDPVVQSIVSLTISLRHKFVKQISAKVTNTLLFLLKKCENPLQCKGFS